MTTRTLRDMQGFFADSQAERPLLKDEPLVYRVFEATDNRPVQGQLRYWTPLIEPGTLGREFFTKGHHHAKSDSAELYLGLRGSGSLVMQTLDGDVDVQEVQPGTAAYVPPHWGRRTANVGRDRFAFLAAYPADAGYDYKTTAEKAFARIVVEQAGRYALAANPRSPR